MDQLPPVNYDDYFQQWRESRLDQKFRPRILFETSRGCWWGEKSHCTFCGLNGLTMKYRSKSATRALEELMHLHQRYPRCSISVVDNILDMKYFQDFIPELAQRKLNLELFYEIKANLKKDHLRLMSEAGIRCI